MGVEDRAHHFPDRRTAVVSVAIATSALVFGREITRRIAKREKRLKLEAFEQSAGDGNYVTTPNDVLSRLT